jgi:hypothetical protein
MEGRRLQLKARFETSYHVSISSVESTQGQPAPPYLDTKLDWMEQRLVVVAQVAVDSKSLKAGCHVLVSSAESA